MMLESLNLKQFFILFRAPALRFQNFYRWLYLTLSFVRRRTKCNLKAVDSSNTPQTLLISSRWNLSYRSSSLNVRCLSVNFRPPHNRAKRKSLISVSMITKSSRVSFPPPLKPPEFHMTRSSTSFVWISSALFPPLKSLQVKSWSSRASFLPFLTSTIKKSPKLVINSRS